MTNRPTIVIIGRPNVGKSSLFNRFLKQRHAIVAPLSGTTRDRIYAASSVAGIGVNLVDTAGLSGDLAVDQLGSAMLSQIQAAVSEADILIFVVDGQEGLTHEDQLLAEIIRKATTPTVVFVNKVDDEDQPVDNKLLNLGIGPTITGSLIHRRGSLALEEALGKLLNADDAATQAQSENISSLPAITIAGRPNVGKSSLFNAIVGKERAIVSDIPGTTRDAIDSKVTLKDGTDVLLIDTAGLRRRGKIGRAEKVEQYSVARTKRAIDRAELVLLVVDGTEGLVRGDVHVAEYARVQGKKLITIINKTDLFEPAGFEHRRFTFLTRSPMIYMSALTGENLTELLELIQESLRSSGETQSQNSLPGR